MKLKFSVLGEPAGKGRPRFRNAGAFVQPYTPEKTVSYPDDGETDEADLNQKRIDEIESDPYWRAIY
mgnify:CR=1 FL=1